MKPITSTEWLVLNATADDAENLEQIYRSLAFECAPDPAHSSDPDACWWREAQPRVLLSEIADAIQSLVTRGLLVPLCDPAEESNPDDVSYVWRAWFDMSADGRSIWAATPSSSPQPAPTRC
jgi:hypothetical protein